MREIGSIVAFTTNRNRVFNRTVTTDNCYSATRTLSNDSISKNDAYVAYLLDSIY